MSTVMHTREGTPEPTVLKPVYGFIKRVLKSGEMGDGLPVRDDVVTFGRDIDCTVKVIHETISRRHVELSVDPITYQATITVLGRSGATVRPASGPKTKLRAGSTYALQPSDVFKIHSTTFSYTAVDPEVYRAESLASIGTPLAQRAVISTPAATPRPISQMTPSRADANTISTPPAVPVQSPLRVPAKIALSTPKGRMSLLKHTVLQSARKQWIAQKPSGLEGAVEEGRIEVNRRKSTSPNKGTGVVELSEESDEGEQEEVPVDEQDQGREQEGKGGEGQIVVLPHDGGQEMQGRDEVDDEYDDIDMGDSSAPVQAEAYRPGLPEDVQTDVAYENDAYDTPDQDDAEAHNHHNEQGLDEEVYEGAELDEEAEYGQEEGIQALAPATPPPTRPLSTFFTPQVRSTKQTDTRRSLAGIGSPAWRPAQFNKAANPLASPAVRLGGPRTTAVQSTPRSVARAGAKAEVKEEEQEEAEEDKVTPVRVKQEKQRLGPSADEIAEMKKRRQSLGTPRALPTAPNSFKTPVPAFSFTKPVHPALAPSHSTPDTFGGPDQHDDKAADDYEDDEAKAPSTPLQSIRKQLDKLRLQAEERTNRRQSTGASLRAPGTPKAGHGHDRQIGGGTTSSFAPVLSFATPARTARTAYAPQARGHDQNPYRFVQPNKPTGTPMPLAPMLEAEEGDSSVSSITLSALGTPTRMGAAGKAGGPAHFTPVRPATRTTPRSHVKATSSGEREAYVEVATSTPPRDTPVKTAPRRSTTPTRPPPLHMQQHQTPDYTAIKHMMPAHPISASTPNMVGLRRMLDTQPQPQVSQTGRGGSPATPQYTGVRQLYPAIPAVQTPDMRGMDEMYATPPQQARREEVEGREKEEGEGEGGAEVIVSPVKHWGANVDVAERADEGMELDEEEIEQGLDEQQHSQLESGREADEEHTDEAANRYNAETDAEGLSNEDDEDDSEEEEEEPIEYRSPVARRSTRLSPVKMSSPSEVSKKLLQSTATFARPATVGRGQRQVAGRVSLAAEGEQLKQAEQAQVAELGDAEEEEQEEEPETREEEARSSRSARVKAAGAARRASPASGSPGSEVTSTSRRRAAPVPRPARTAATATSTGPIKTEPEAVSKSAPTRATRRKAEPAAALEEAGVQGVVEEKPSARSTSAASRATKGKATRSTTANISTSTRAQRAGTAAAEEQVDEDRDGEEEADAVEVKSAPARRTRTVVRSTAPAAPGSASATAAQKDTGKGKDKADKTSAPTRATRSTRAKGVSASTTVGEEKENMDVQRPSRSTRSRR